MPGGMRYVRTGVTVLCLTFTAAGIVLAIVVHCWGADYDRRLDAIRKGAVAPTPFVVAEKLESSLRLEPLDGGASIWELVTPEELAGVTLGERVACYRFGDVWIVPRFDTGGFYTVKWILLLVAVFPAAILLLFRRRSRTPGIAHRKP